MNDKTTPTTLTEGNASMDDIATGLLLTGKTASTTPKPSGTADTQQVDDDTLLPGEDTDNAGDDVWNSDDEQSNDADPANEGDEGGDGNDDDNHEGKDNNEPFYTVTIDGKSERVPLSEALKGYQRNRDYTRKTQELAQLRQSIEAEQTAAKTARAQYDQQLATVLEALGDEKNDPKAEDWERLKAESPETYAVEYADYLRRVEARGQVKQERERIVQEQQAETVKVIRDVAAVERNKLLEHFPTWKEPEKYKTGAKAIFDFASNQYGFSAKELSTTIDHRIIRMAEDARRYRALVTKQEAAKSKIDNAPVVQPRGRTPTPSRKVVQAKEARTRAERTGKIDDIAALIMTK